MPKLKFPKPLQIPNLHSISTDLENKNKQLLCLTGFMVILVKENYCSGYVKFCVYT